ncbi:hypothetical protein ETB97_002614 [Aspergillus alliaceus]|uniref:Uncharacterized protein n=1 Tax=Petromyces alliaceus TaxID=209559 RepID=A0A8H6A2V0_PETAA|nr:hypothetical protein ETB97_002614 [Aspergillus burnettii]
MSPPKRVLNRPKKRTLVRWDDNLNELLLLSVLPVCNNQAIKIPWSEVASTMKNNVTEGAIVQLLAKLRSRRAEAGKDVPPPLKRGGVGPSSKPSGNSSTSNAQGAKRNHKSSSLVSEEDEALEMALNDDSTSDKDYVDKGRRPNRRMKKSNRRKGHISQRREAVHSRREDEGIVEAEGSTGDPEELLPTGELYNGYPSTYEQSVASALSTYDIAPYPASYQHLSGPGLGMGNRCILGYNPIPDMPAVVSGGAIHNLTSFGKNQGLHSTTYVGYQDPVYYHRADEPVGFCSEIADSHTGNLYSENYPYLQGDYTEPNDG